MPIVQIVTHSNRELAQLLERHPYKVDVVGSSPAFPTKTSAEAWSAFRFPNFSLAVVLSPPATARANARVASLLLECRARSEERLRRMRSMWRSKTRTMRVLATTRPRSEAAGGGRPERRARHSLPRLLPKLGQLSAVLRFFDRSLMIWSARENTGSWCSSGPDVNSPKLSRTPNGHYRSAIIRIEPRDKSSSIHSRSGKILYALQIPHTYPICLAQRILEETSMISSLALLYRWKRRHRL